MPACAALGTKSSATVTGAPALFVPESPPLPQATTSTDRTSARDSERERTWSEPYGGGAMADEIDEPTGADDEAEVISDEPADERKKTQVLHTVDLDPIPERGPAAYVAEF